MKTAKQEYTVTVTEGDGLAQKYSVTLEPTPANSDYKNSLDGDETIMKWINAFNIFVISIVVMFAQKMYE